MVILRAKSHQIVTGDVNLYKQTCSTILFTPGSVHSYKIHVSFWSDEVGVRGAKRGIIILHVLNNLMLIFTV